MKLQQVKQLRDMNVELLQVNLRIWKNIREYCKANDIDLPYDSRTDYNIAQAFELVKAINETALSHDFEQRKNHTRDRTEPIVFSAASCKDLSSYELVTRLAKGLIFSFLLAKELDGLVIDSHARLFQSRCSFNSLPGMHTELICTLARLRNSTSKLRIPYPSIKK